MSIIEEINKSERIKLRWWDYNSNPNLFYCIITIIMVVIILILLIIFSIK
jgi:hypothetical protein